jgi:hypothetical protein
MHPFLDGNGRTARALEALMLQRLGLRDSLFIAMSNYYYENKAAYLQALGGHDLTPFLVFALRGIEVQCKRLLAEIRQHLKRALFRNTMHELFGRLRSPRKRVMNERHMQLLNLLLDVGELSLSGLLARSAPFYRVANPRKALIRDLTYLIELEAIRFEPGPNVDQSRLIIDLEWPMRITETEFFRWAKSMPKGKVHGFLSS